MTYALETLNFKDAAGASQPFSVVRDSSDQSAANLEAGVIYDPDTGKWASVDASGRVAALVDFNGPQPVDVLGVASVDDTTDVLTEVTLLGSVARTASVGVTATGQTKFRGAYVSVDVSATAGGSITPVFYVINGSFAKNLTVLTAPAALTAVGTTWFYVGPTAVPAAVIPANQQAVMTLPKNWGVSVTANNANSITYSATVLYHK